MTANTSESKWEEDIHFSCVGAFLHPVVPKGYLPWLPCEVCAGGMAFCGDLINTWDLSSLLGSVFDFR